MLVTPRSSRPCAAVLLAALIVGASCRADDPLSSTPRDAAPSTTVPDLARVSNWIEDARYDQALAAIEVALAACAESERAEWRHVRSRALRLAARARDPRALADALFAAESARASGDPDRVASALFDLGALHLVLDEPDAAAAALSESLAACTSIGAAADAQRADVCVYRAELAANGGDRDGALELLREASAIQERVLDPTDPRVAFRLKREANLAYRCGDPERALELGTRALDAYRARLRPDHPRIASALHNLGAYHQLLDDLPAAARAFEAALEIRRTEGSPLVGNSLMLLAQVRELLGDVEAADHWNEESIAWIERAKGPAAPELRTPLQALALSALRAQDPDAAERYVRRALGLLGREDRSTVDDRGALEEILGHVAWQRGEREAAMRVWRAALATLEDAGASERDAAADILCDLGLAEAAAGSADGAAAGTVLLERALAIRRGLVGDEHPDLARTLACFADAARASGRGDDAFRAALEAASIVRRHIDGTTLRLDERDALGYATELTPGLPLAVVLAAESSSTRAVPAWNAVVAARAAVFESVRQSRASPGVGLRAGGSAGATAALGIADVANAREDGVALVAYVRCTRPDAYVAFVLAPGSSDPHAVDLGSAVEIDALAAPVCALSRRPGSEAAWRETAAPLRVRVWDPIAEFLRGAREIHVVPDGALLLVDLASLPVDESEYLIETAPPLHVLSAERDVVAARAKGPLHAGSSDRMLAVGGPDYGPVPTTETTGTRAPSAPPAVFEPLALAADEARAVAAAWSERGVPAHVLVGSDATEASLRADLGGLRILHVATHGFSHSTSGSAIGRGLATAPSALPPLTLRLGLSRRHIGTSGLALAGANTRREAAPEDDGILLDGDVISLDLHGLDLAILSACDSGAGEVQNGEGIFGLRRAFSMAGARTVVASSWPVADETACTIMTDFHSRLARGSTSVARALHDAKRAELARLRAAHLDTHPWHWAGFLATGEPSSIR